MLNSDGEEKKKTLPAESTNPPAAASDASVCHVSINIPKFYKPDPEMFFLNIESQFALAKITSDHTRYVHLTAKLEPEILAEVSDVIRNPETQTYIKLKEAIIKRFGQTDEDRLNRLLGSMDLGDKQPSQLLREIQKLAPDVPTKIVRGLWLKKLPGHVQQILQAVSHVDLSQQAEIADKVVSVQTSSIAAVRPEVNPPPPSNLADLSQDIKTLTKTMTEFINTFRASSSRSRSPARSLPYRSHSRESGSQDRKYCYLHYKFGKDARFCRNPLMCQFPQSNPGNESPSSHQ
ncbi:uncharacterized protein LOC103523718 [Diaphorina citri]|uniref:Uncharacterized protein LOC103523718 n=1 Tax=Diaphorina citri TaxID=121845 RepID=A0A1S3DSQ4_DIACI|nr:uncharacterized protein LOC103523718 [Diaphorina citri]